MKLRVHQLRVGEVVKAQVVENVSAENFIVSFSGDLIRVKNQTGKLFDIGQQIHLKVTSLNPLSFSYFALSRTNRVI